MALSDKRRLGTESGRLRRLARQVERDGGNPSGLLNAAAEAKMGEGSAISSSEENDARDQYERRLNRGLNTLALRSMMSQAGGPATTATPSPARTATTAAPAPGSGAFRNETGSSMGWKNVGGTSTPDRATSATPAPVQREGRIDGRPASEVLSAAPAPAPSFSKATAEKNLAEGGLDSAVADYRRRATASEAPVADAGPGNMQQAAARDASRYTFSPLGQALLNAQAQRISAAGETAPAEEIAGPPASAANPRPAPEIAGPPASAANRPAARTMDLTQERPDARLTLNQSLNRDAATVQSGISGANRILGRGIESVVRTGADLLRSGRDAVADDAAERKFFARRLGSSLIPGQTGRTLRENVRQQVDEQKQENRRALRRIPLPNILTR